MSIEEYLEREKKLQLEFDISLFKLQQEFVDSDNNNHPHWNHEEEHVRKFINKEHIELEFKGIKMSENYECPLCKAFKSCLIGQTPNNFFSEPDPGYRWLEVHQCSDCHNRYIISNEI